MEVPTAIIILIVAVIFFAMKANTKPQVSIKKQKKQYKRTLGPVQSKRSTNALLTEIEKLISMGETAASIARRAGVSGALISKYRSGIKPTKKTADALREACQQIAKERGVFNT